MSGRGERRPWRENIEAVAMAVIMALLLKHFIVEAYKIPTGSMQPTLIGDERAKIFDRILVDKLTYQLRDPERWEVVIFRYPLDRSKNFVKRIVGMGPEYVRVENGDLWHRTEDSEPWRILRRPRSVQEETWKRLDADEPDDASWRGIDEAGDWTFAGRAIQARGDGRARFRPERGPIRDRYLDGYPAALAERVAGKPGAGSNHVGDLRVDGEVRALAGTTSVHVDLEEGGQLYRLRLPGPAADEAARPSIVVVSPSNGHDPPMAVAAEPYRLPAGEGVRFAAQNLDDLLELEVAGDVVCALEIDASRDGRSAAYLGVEGEGAELDELMVYRDIHYTPSKAGSRGEHVPAGHYYMLGDNTQDSSDSREWTFARYELPVEGDEPVRVVRGNWRRGENPRTVGHGDPEGPLLRLDDEWGETHWLRHADVRQLPPEEAPLVPREMIQGRAVAVFWPLKPRIGVYRLKWVH